jgi:hypothetical protein
MREDMGHESWLLNKQPADRDLTGAFTPQHVAPMILRGSFNLSVGSPHSKLPLRSPGIECFLQKLNHRSDLGKLSGTKALLITTVKPELPRCCTVVLPALNSQLESAIPQRQYSLRMA